MRLLFLCRATHEQVLHTQKIEVKYAEVVESHGSKREQVARDTVLDVHRSGQVVV
jgi:hypothetical protein